MLTPSLQVSGPTGGQPVRAMTQAAYNGRDSQPARLAPGEFRRSRMPAQAEARSALFLMR
ncbi:MAG: hypothetical protein AMXMBFR13_31030 [Phycisphaerae bacterium]